MPALFPMPVISRNVPAYTNDNNNGSNPASLANDFTYGGAANRWQTATVVAGGLNNGPLTQSVYLAYDLSGIPINQRQNVVLIWYNDPVSTWSPTDSGVAFNGMPQDYTIDTNTAIGGSLPSSGWVTQITVSGNIYASRQHAFNLNGANWIRMNITGGHGTAAFSTTNIVLNMDVHDAHIINNGITFFGDSLGDVALNHDDTGADGLGLTLSGQVNQVRPGHWPYWDRACVPGYRAFDLMSIISTWLPLATGKYVVIQIGANDANQGGALVTNYTSNMQAVINACVAAGKTCIIPHIHWARTTNIQTNGPTINADIDALIAANPTTCIAGPDMWAYFFANQNLITTLGAPDNDGLHPTNPAGMAAYRTQFALWAEANLYPNVLNSPTRTTYKVRTVLNTNTRTTSKVRTILKTAIRTLFKIQFSGAGPKPYIISEVGTTTIARPFSTIASQAIVQDTNRILQDTLTATVIVTFPDNSTANATVYWLGKGTYEAVYTTKGAGTISELWTFTDSQGSQAEYKNLVPCNF